MSLVMQLVIFDTIHVTFFGNKTFVIKLNVPQSCSNWRQNMRTYCKDRHLLTDTWNVN